MSALAIEVVVQFLRRHWRVLALAGVVAALGLQTARLAHAKADLAEAQAALKDPATGKTWQSEAVARGRDLATCRGNVTALNGAIEGQNASIDALKREADASSARATAKIRAAQADSAKARRDVAAIMAKRPGGDLCASALALIKETNQ